MNPTWLYVLALYAIQRNDPKEANQSVIVNQSKSIIVGTFIG